MSTTKFVPFSLDWLRSEQWIDAAERVLEPEVDSVSFETTCIHHFLGVNTFGEGEEGWSITGK